jgi:hypothetical protein
MIPAPDQTEPVDGTSAGHFFQTTPVSRKSLPIRPTFDPARKSFLERRFDSNLLLNLYLRFCSYIGQGS